MRDWPIAVLVLVGTACAGSLESRQSDQHDHGYDYLRQQEQPCPADKRAQCCQERSEALKRAKNTGEAETVAFALDALALWCPERRAEATEELQFVAPAVSDPQAGTIEVEFGADILDSDRIHWASAFIDRRYQAGTKLVPGPHRANLEFHVVTADNSGNTQLTRVKLEKEIDLPPNARLRFTVTLRRQPGVVPVRDAFWLDVTKPEPVPPLTPEQAKPPDPELAKQVVGGRRKRWSAPRFPWDLHPNRPWAILMRVCVNEQGRVETVSLLERAVHPRLFGPVLDSFVRAQYDPVRVRGKAVPFCHPVRLELRAG